MGRIEKEGQWRGGLEASGGAGEVEGGTVMIKKKDISRRHSVLMERHLGRLASRHGRFWREHSEGERASRGLKVKVERGLGEGG